MATEAGGHSFDGALSLVADLPTIEREKHQEFVHRHIDFLVDLLVGEELITGCTLPASCPEATPEVVARRTKQGGATECRFSRISDDDGEDNNSCSCRDPLSGSDDPLDAVAAVTLASGTDTISSRYFDHEWRRVVRGLRTQIGTWEQIADLDYVELEAELRSITNRPGICDSRVSRLYELLESVEECSLTDSITLAEISPVPYDRLCAMLAGFPGISRPDGWWLILSAFDKPVWPADSAIDRLLCSLGLLPLEKLGQESERHTELEDKLTDRQIPELYRAIASHAERAEADICGENCDIEKFLLPHRARCQANKDTGPITIDLFAGAGGLSLGFRRAGYQLELAIDHDQTATDTYRFNNPEIPHRQVICQDIKEISGEQLKSHFDREIDVVIGGPPCQALSQAGYRSRLANDPDYSVLDDDRTTLYTQYVESLRELSPRVIVMENVEGLVNEVGETGKRVIDEVLTALSEEGYQCDYRLLDCSELGIPQRRERVIILGVREDILTGGEKIGQLFNTLHDISSNKEYTFRQALSGLPKILRGEGGLVRTDQLEGAPSKYVDENELRGDTQLTFNHRAREHPKPEDRELFDKAMSPGDTGWDIKHHSEFGHLIDYDVGSEDSPRFKDKYRMLHWDQPAPTVVAHLAKDANNFIIPDYYSNVRNDKRKIDRRRNRGITPREAARLQSFPDDYIFLGTFTQWFRQIGNAVPPVLGELLGRVVSPRLYESTSQDMTWRSRSAASTDD